MLKTREYKLKYLTEKITKGTTPSNIGETFTDEGIMYFRSELIGKTKYVDKSSGLLYISESTHEKLKRSQIKENDMLFSMAGIYLGKISLVSSSDIPANTNQAVAIIRFNSSNIDLNYVYYYMTQKWYNSYINSLTAQAAQPNINLEQIGKLKLYLPDIKIQNKIAKIISRYDEAIENNNKRIKLLEQMAQNLYKEWFVRFRFPGYENCEFENGIPVGWNVEKVKNLVKRLPFGKTYKKQELSNIGKIIVIDQSEDEVLGYHDDVPSHKASFDEPVALFGDHSCKYVLMTEDFSLGENIIPYLGNNIDLYYLYYSVYKIIQTEEYKRHWNLFINKKILVPIEEFQLKFRNQLIPILSTIQKLKKQNMNLSQQRDLLLPRLMSGKLEVN